jgi:glycosyltransferase involved in cell wall biosynthesis/SAM-dependent methyltransferase
MNAQKPSVMMIISQFRPVASGAELQAERLAYKLAGLGFPLQVLTQHRDPTSLSDEIFRGVKIHRCDFPLAYNLNYEAVPTLHYLIKKRHTFDILHNHQMWGHAVVATLVARWLGKKNVIKLACAGTFGDLEVLSTLRYAKWGLQVLQMADAIIAVSHEIQSELLEYGFAAEKIHRIPNGVDVEEFQRSRPFPSNPRRRFILLGRRTPQKGIDTALKALKILADKGLAVDLELKFYGWDYAEWDYRQMAQDLGVEELVTFLPFENNVLDVYQAAYCLLLPSVGEGLSNVLLEAMSLEMPVIASKVSGTEEVLDDQKNGLLIPPGSPEALASAMDLVLAKPELAFDWGRQARRKVQEHYSLDAVAQKYAKLYDFLVSKKGSRHKGLDFLEMSSPRSIMVAAPGCPAGMIGELLEDRVLPASTNLEVLLPPGNPAAYDGLCDREIREGAQVVVTSGLSFFSTRHLQWLREKLRSCENVFLLIPQSPYQDSTSALASLITFLVTGKAITILRPADQAVDPSAEPGIDVNRLDVTKKWLVTEVNRSFLVKELRNFVWSASPDFIKNWIKYVQRELGYYLGAYNLETDGTLPFNLQPLDFSPEALERDVKYALGTANTWIDVLPGGADFLKGKKVMEIGPGINFGSILTLACLGAQVLVTDRFLTPWDPEYHPKFYALLRESLAERWPSIDLSPLEKIIAERHYPRESICAYTCSLEKLSGVPDQSLDLVISNAVFEHLYDLKSAFAHLARITKPGGLGLHQVDFRDHRDYTRPLEYLLLSKKEFSIEFRERHGECGNRFRPNEMWHIFESVGFEVKEFRPDIFVEEEYLQEFLGRLRRARKSRYVNYDVEDLRHVSGLFILVKK